MTREEIISMEPGRELDQLVAEKIMGYQSYGDFPVHAIYNGLTATSFTIFQPSIDIKAAWEVVDKIKIAVIPQSIGAPDDMKYLAKIEDHPHEYQSFATTAPLAICRCALLAVLEATP